MSQRIQNQLQAVGDTLTVLERPENVLQAVLILAAIALGWWAARLVRSRITVVPDPDDMPDRAREMLYIGAPLALTLAILAAVDGFLHAFGSQAGVVDVAVQLTGLLLLIRLVVYVVRVSLGARARLKGWGMSISVVIWVFLALHLLGWGDAVIEALDSVGHECRQDPHLRLVGHEAAGRPSASSSSPRCGPRAGSNGACSSSMRWRRPRASASPSSVGASWSASAS